MVKKKKLSRNSKLSRGKRNTVTTKSGKIIKINRSLKEKFTSRKEEKARRKAERLAGMPKSRVKRFFWRLHPKRMYKYWFSREGGIMALKVTGVSIVAGFILVAGVFAYFRKDLPDLRDISGDNIGGSVQYYDRTGQHLLWEDFDAVKRVPVAGDQISQNLKDATVAIEDQEFYNHGGFDAKGISRAAINNVLGGGETRQGGSTITQQLVRLTNDEVGKEQTYQRKIKELILSIELERSFSKEEILTGYLNTAPYGNVQYGAQAASQDYFEKSANELTLDEAAFMAGIPKSPSALSPYGAYYDEEQAVGRQHYILDLMVEQGFITSEERDEAKAVDTLAKIKESRPKYEGINAPWFVLTAKEELERRFGEQGLLRGGWRITTTLNLDIQKIAETQVANGIGQVRAQGGDVAALAIEDVETGQMVALVGGPDFTNEAYGQNNYAREKIPPGSSIKPYDYLAMMENTTNTGAGSVLYDTKAPIEGYACTIPGRNGNCLTDYDFRYPGPLTIRYALGGSRNVPAVKAMLTAGVDKTIDLANNLMGDVDDGYGCYDDEQLTKPAQCYGSAALGDGAYLQLDEHVHGYASISRHGKVLPMTYILKIEEGDGTTLEEWKLEEGEQVIRPDSAYIIADILSDPRASYLSSKPHDYWNGIGNWDFSMKTGTTNDSKDGLLLGFSTKYAAGVWVGYHNRQVEMTGFMENMTMPIWNNTMKEIHNNLEPIPRQRPESVKEAPAYVVRTHVGVGSIEPSPSTDLYPSWYEGNATNGEKKVIDKVSKKVATDCTPGRARQQTNEGSANQFSADIFVDGGAAGANTNEKDDVHSCDDRKPSIRLVTTKVNDSTYRLEADVTGGTHPLHSADFPGTVTFFVGDEAVKTLNITGPGTVSYNYSPNFTGKRTVRAEVVDSVLYDASDTGSITVAASNNNGGGNGGNGGNSDDISLTSSTTTESPAYNLTWSGGTGPFNVTVDGSPAASCQNNSNRSCVLAFPDKDKDYAIVINDSAGNSLAVTITREDD